MMLCLRVHLSVAVVVLVSLLPLSTNSSLLLDRIESHCVPAPDAVAVALSHPCRSPVLLLLLRRLFPLVAVTPLRPGPTHLLQSARRRRRFRRRILRDGASPAPINRSRPTGPAAQ